MLNSEGENFKPACQQVPLYDLDYQLLLCSEKEFNSSENSARVSSVITNALNLVDAESLKSRPTAEFMLVPAFNIVSCFLSDVPII